MEKIKEVNVKSLEFHLYRGDFEKWINEVLEDAALAEEIRKLKMANLTGENLRNQLYLTVARELKRLVGSISTI
ncbi:MAG: hypothetical protein ACP5JW_03910 [Candidatus Bathyarchaeia archaeon]